MCVTHVGYVSPKELLDEAKGGTFSVIKLWKRINSKRITQAALMWDCLQQYRSNVELSRLDPNPEQNASFWNEEPEKGSLVLRFSLKDEKMKNSQVEKLAQELPAVFKQAGVLVRRMEYVELERRDDEAKACPVELRRRHNAAAAFLRAVRQVRKGRSNDKSNHAELARQSTAPESKKRKSSYTDTLLEPKRRTREISYMSVKAAHSELCMPPKRSMTPGPEVNDC
jgi:hypothetical protein